MSRKRVSANRRQRERLKQEIDRALRASDAMPADVMHAGEHPTDENSTEARTRRQQ
jgi:hypothetical protein